MKNKLIFLAVFRLVLLANVANIQEGFGTNDPKSTVDIQDSLATTLTELTDASGIY